MPCPPDRLRASVGGSTRIGRAAKPPGATHSVPSPFSGFPAGRGAFRPAPRTDAAVMLSKPARLSARRALFMGRLRGFLHDVTGDHPTIQKGTQKAEHTHSVCSAEKDAQSPHKPPLFRAEWRRTQWARRIGASYQYRTKRKVCSRPCAVKARLISGRALCDPAACAAVRRSFPQNQQSSCPTPFV